MPIYSRCHCLHNISGMQRSEAFFHSYPERLRHANANRHLRSCKSYCLELSFYDFLDRENSQCISKFIGAIMQNRLELLYHVTWIECGSRSD